MAVAKVIETRTYFHERDTESPESPRPCKRQRLETPVPRNDSPQPLTQQEQGYTPPPNAVSHYPSPSPARVSTPLPKDPVISKAAREALAGPWTGPTNFCYDDDENFDDPNDIGVETAQPVPVPDPTEPESSDTESDADADIDDAGLSESDVGEVPDIFETNADLDAAEYSECTIVSEY